VVLDWLWRLKVGALVKSGTSMIRSRNVVDARQRVLREVFLGRDGDDAFIDGVAQLDRAAADVGEDRVERLGEADVAERGGDRRVAVDAGRLQRAPANFDVGAGDVAQEIDRRR
jgi:hypothetical protein